MDFRHQRMEKCLVSLENRSSCKEEHFPRAEEGRTRHKPAGLSGSFTQQKAVFAPSAIYSLSKLIPEHQTESTSLFYVKRFGLKRLLRGKTSSISQVSKNVGQRTSLKNVRHLTDWFLGFSPPLTPRDPSKAAKQAVVHSNTLPPLAQIMYQPTYSGAYFACITSVAESVYCGEKKTHQQPTSLLSNLICTGFAIDTLL